MDRNKNGDRSKRAIVYPEGPLIGLVIPDRPISPSEGRAQHYRRDGDPKQQKTKSFRNGTTLTFGAKDPVSDIQPGDPFYEQNLVILRAEHDIKAVVAKQNAAKPPFLKARGSSIDDDSDGDLNSSENSPKDYSHLERRGSVDSLECFPGYLGTKTHDETTAMKLRANQKAQLQSSSIPSTVNVYQNPWRIGLIPGIAHPGDSSDTRHGISAPEEKLLKLLNARGLKLPAKQRESGPTAQDESHNEHSNTQTAPTGPEAHRPTPPTTAVLVQYNMPPQMGRLPHSGVPQYVGYKLSANGPLIVPTPPRQPTPIQVRNGGTVVQGQSRQSSPGGFAVHGFWTSENGQHVQQPGLLLGPPRSTSAAGRFYFDTETTVPHPESLRTADQLQELERDTRRRLPYPAFPGALPVWSPYLKSLMTPLHPWLASGLGAEASRSSSMPPPRCTPLQPSPFSNERAPNAARGAVTPGLPSPYDQGFETRGRQGRNPVADSRTAASRSSSARIMRDFLDTTAPAYTWGTNSDQGEETRGDTQIRHRYQSNATSGRSSENAGKSGSQTQDPRFLQVPSR